MDPVVLHCDANSYFASVEVLHNPHLRGKPVAVGGDVEARHGIILAKTQEAKKYGVQTGEAIWQARQKCPGLVIVPPHYELYIRFCREIRNIFAQYTDQIEPFGIDEAWLDVTDGWALFGTGEQIANEIRERVKRELGLTVSIGVSYNKIFAKLGSDIKKPDAVTVISQDNYKQVAWSLPVQEMLYVGRATQIKLNARGVMTIGQLANTEPELLRFWFGKVGDVLWCFANGMDLSPVKSAGDESPIKSIGNSVTTPKDITNEQDASIVYHCLCDVVAERLREQGLKGTTVQISLRGNDLHGFVRQTKLKKPTYLSGELHRVAMHLLRANYHFIRPLRSIGVRAMGLVPVNAPTQMSLFEDEERRLKLEALETTIDGIRKRYGHYAVTKAITHLDTQLGSIDAKGDHTVHPIGYFS